jgi:hypothetical protein
MQKLLVGYRDKCACVLSLPERIHEPENDDPSILEPIKLAASAA